MGAGAARPLVTRGERLRRPLLPLFPLFPCLVTNPTWPRLCPRRPCGPQYGSTALMLAAQGGHDKMTEALLAAGANKDARDEVRMPGFVMRGGV